MGQPDTRFQPGNPVGRATRFQPGNKGGGRPATAKFSAVCRRLLKERGENGQRSWESTADLLAKNCLREALGGSADHQAIILRYSGPETWREIREVTQECLENGYMLRPRRKPRKVLELSKTGVNGEENVENRAFANKQEALPESQAKPASLYEIAKGLVAVGGDRPEFEQAPASAKRVIRVELW
jgi:hypothetical protein